MNIYTGKGVSPGVAIGTVCLWQKQEDAIEHRKLHASDIPQELARLHEACREADAQLEKLYQQAVTEVGEEHAAIFDIHRKMLKDADFLESVETHIRTELVDAASAVSQTEQQFAQMFAAMEDAYMQARSADVHDAAERLLRILQGGREQAAPSAAGILVAQDLAPSETMQFDKEQLLGFVTVQGSANSHTAILARSRNLPAVVHCSIPLTPELDGMPAALDGTTGNLYVNPTEEVLQEMRAKQKSETEYRKLLDTLRGKENRTPDGHTIKLYANIGNVDDLDAVLRNDAGGVGLFRSEFLYLERTDFPSEEEQFQAYKSAAEMLDGKELIIRTLDIGADKQAAYFGLEPETNSAMGLRAIRICLTRPELFRTQLRAIFRASVYGNVRLMYPMITSVRELRQLKAMAKQVMEELQEAGIPVQDVPQGVMIETPAAVMVSEELAQEADFFSIGTNDLTQYTLAVDRQNPRLEHFYDPHHPAVLQMIRMVTEHAHRHGIPVGICGELAADESLTEWFLEIGMDELSVTPSSILPLRKKIRETSVTGTLDT